MTEREIRKLVNDKTTFTGYTGSEFCCMHIESDYKRLRTYKAVCVWLKEHDDPKSSVDGAVNKYNANKLIFDSRNKTEIDLER